MYQRAAQKTRLKSARPFDPYPVQLAALENPSPARATA